MQRWPSEKLLQAEADRIRSSVRLTELIEQLTEPAPAADVREQHVREGVCRLVRRALSAGILAPS